MVRTFFGLFFMLTLMSSTLTLAQKTDSIALTIQLDTLNHQLQVNQHFYIYNHSQQPINELKIHAWANAYSGRQTELNRIKLEDRKGSLHFSTKKERGGTRDLQFFNELGKTLAFTIKEREFITIPLDEALPSKEKIHFVAQYTVKIPSNVFTKYGYSSEGDYLLKYFFLQPVTQKNNQWVIQHFKDFEELVANPTNYTLKLDIPDSYNVLSDLEHINNIWIGKKQQFFRLYLTKNPQRNHTVQMPNFKVDFGYKTNPQEKPITDSLVKEQIQFLEQYLGELPINHLFVSQKTQKEQAYFGVDDLDAWLLKIKLFTPKEKSALKLFQLLSYEYLNQLFMVDMRKDHWVKNGLQVYLQMKYVDENFPDLKLAGHFADDFKVLGIKPLNSFHAAKLKMNDRYKLLYLYMARQNYDQPINTPFDQFSNLNQVAISGFKTGLTFYYIDKYLQENEFKSIIKKFSKKNTGKLVNQNNFKAFVLNNASQGLTWFFDDYINDRKKINFKLAKVKSNNDSLILKLKNRTNFKGPFKIIGIKNDSIIAKQWYSDANKKIAVNFPKKDYDKLVVNPGYLFPEFNDRDNYLKTKGLFKNGKKVQLKLYSDIENPEYTQIFMIPQMKWNNYDKFQIGIKFNNQSLLTQPFKYNITPKYSTGTNSLTGSANVGHTIYPERGWFRSINFGGGIKYEHYDKELSYTKWYSSVTASFVKSPRTAFSQGISLSYNNLNKEVPLGIAQTDEDKYSLLGFSYYISKPTFIHDFSGSLTFQTTDQFQKIYGEAYYRWRFSPKHRLGVRLFAGIFTANKSDTDYFNFGLSHVSDYGFNFSLLGRSETSGVLSQQFVLAEGGFKSAFNATVNNWLLTTNVEVPIWKMFDLYADAGVYKNKTKNTEFIYDTGVRLRVIPDFLELYLPVQSSLGFEPTMDNYWQRVRFTVSLNLSKIISYARRGLY